MIRRFPPTGSRGLHVLPRQFYKPLTGGTQPLLAQLPSGLVAHEKLIADFAFPADWDGARHVLIMTPPIPAPLCAIIS
jgi:hypothetical protein